MFCGCGRQEASTRLQPVQRLWLRAGLRPTCRRVPAMPLDGDRGRAGRPLVGGLARQPALRIKFRNKTAQDRHRCRTVERPSEAATSLPTSIVNRVRRTVQPGQGVTYPKHGAGRAKPGGTLLTPTSARPSCRSPFDSIEGDAPRRGDLPSPAAVPEPCRHRDGPRSLSGAGISASGGASQPSSGRGSCACRTPGTWGQTANFSAALDRCPVGGIRPMPADRRSDRPS